MSGSCREEAAAAQLLGMNERHHVRAERTLAQVLTYLSECSLTKTFIPALTMAVCRAETLIHLLVS